MSCNNLIKPIITYSALRFVAAAASLLPTINLEVLLTNSTSLGVTKTTTTTHISTPTPTNACLSQAGRCSAGIETKPASMAVKYAAHPFGC